MITAHIFSSAAHPKNCWNLEKTISMVNPTYCHVKRHFHNKGNNYNKSPWVHTSQWMSYCGLDTKVSSSDDILIRYVPFRWLIELRDIVLVRFLNLEVSCSTLALIPVVRHRLFTLEKRNQKLYYLQLTSFYFHTLIPICNTHFLFTRSSPLISPLQYFRMSWPAW